MAVRSTDWPRHGSRPDRLPGRGTLIAWAKELGRQDVVDLLQQTLDEEKATDQKLTAIAEAQVNRKAA